MTQKRAPFRIGAISVIASFLILSAVLRIALGADAAFAREDEETAPETQTGPRKATLSEADIQPLLDALTARESRLIEREEAVAVRQKALELAEQKIDRQLIQLEQAEQALKATMSIAETAAEDDLAQLTNVYATMKPKQAAALFEAMDPEFAAGFLGRMRPDAAAAILAGLTPASAYTVSVILAGRNASIPKE